MALWTMTLQGDYEEERRSWREHHARRNRKVRMEFDGISFPALCTAGDVAFGGKSSTGKSQTHSTLKPCITCEFEVGFGTHGGCHRRPPPPAAATGRPPPPLPLTYLVYYYVVTQMHDYMAVVRGISLETVKLT